MFKRITTFITLVCFSFTSIFFPVSRVWASSGEYVHKNWIPVTMPSGQKFSYSYGNFAPVAEFGTATDPKSQMSDIQMIKGPRWITLGRYDHGQFKGKDPNLITSDLLMKFASNKPIVFGLYDTTKNELRIKVVKLFKDITTNKIETHMGDYTPWDAERLRKEYAYLTDDERKWATLGYGLVNGAWGGYNPFERFMSTGDHKTADKTDPVFYRIGWDAALVAVGHAMMKHRSAVSFVAVPDPRMTSSTHCSGKIRKKCTTYVDGYAKPVWFVGTPASGQPRGAQLAMICARNVNPCDAPEHMVSSGAVFQQWTGGTMKEGEDHIYHWEHTKKSWTVLAFTILTAALVFAGAGFSGFELFNVGGTSAVGSGALAGGAWSAIELSAVAGAAYAGFTMFTQGGPITAAQSNWLGNTGTGVKMPADPGSEQGRGLSEQINQRMIHKAPNQAGQLSAIQQQFRGVAPKPGQYSEENTVRIMQKAAQRCASEGYPSGSPLHNKCVAYYASP